MSSNTKINIPKLVEKYRHEFPQLEKRLLRRMIRKENHITDSTEIRQLSRYLQKAFKNETKPSAKGEPSDFDIERIKEEYVHGCITEAWNRLILLADRLRLKPHPIESYNEKMKQAKQKYGINLVMFDPMIALNVKKDVIREALRFSSLV